MNNLERPILFYVHGFLSGGKSLKGQAFARRYGAHMEVVLPSYTQQTPDRSLYALRHLLQRRAGVNTRKGVIVGSSLGGFYGQVLAKEWQWPLIMINPALDSACLSPASLLGTHTNPYTGERITVDENWLAQLVKWQRPPVSPSLLIICEDDTVVLPHCALERYREQARIVTRPEGGHACWPMTPVWPEIDTFLEEQGLL